LLFILSFVNRFYYQFKNKVAYLLTNISIMVIMPLVLFVYFIKKSVFLAEISFQSLQDILSISGYILRHMQDAVGTIPVINMIVDSVVADGITLHFAFSYIVIVIAGTILAYITIQNISTNYFRNGILENEQTNNRSSKVHISKNKWSNYIQREFWVLNSEAYFKLQFIMGMIMAPIVSLIYFLLIQSEWLPAYVNMTDNENFTMYYFYFILFLSTMNNISGTPYSREGKYHYLLNSTPLNSRFIYFTKVFVASSMSM